MLLDPAEEPDVARVAAAGSVSDVTFGHPSLSGEPVEVPYSADDELGRGSTGLQRIASELLVADLYDCG